MPKIIFVEPKATEEHIFARFKLPRLGLLILGTMIKKRGWDVEVIIENLSPIRIDDLSRADIVGISAITNTVEKAYSLADRLRKKGVPAILGGPHVTFMPDEALEHADFVLRGEAEFPFMDFIDAWEGRRPFTDVPGLSYMKDGIKTHNRPPEKPTVLDDLPVIDLSVLKNGDSLKVLPVQTSRGCPFDCSFCSVTGMFGRKFRYRSTEHIMKELRTYRNMGKMIFFYDDHFAANKARAKELLREMIREGLNFKWSTQVRVEVARDRELLELMKRAGCHTLFIGFESVNPRSLVEMNKSQTIEDIKNAVSVIHSYGIHVHGMFVYGFENDTNEMVNQTVDFATALDITSAQFLILTPYPGTAFHHKVKESIITSAWSLYDTHHVVFSPKNFSMMKLQYSQIKSHRKFYSMKRMINLIRRKKWLALGIAFYARFINFLFVIQNIRYFLKIISHDRARAGAGSITIRQAMSELENNQASVSEHYEKECHAMK
ncbi:MAG TPA: radical SAM protein [Spirochaetota bacterium]|nr:radical SAM protein [Spirochaetota bacterium]HPI89926.1 radical SAM protein [Spirochaetota bacterium]HPR49054.1 radical SAM protein [Spirochaetota bacterium]